MKINPFPRKLTKTTLSLALIVASICVLAVYLWNGVIHEDFRESLTIEEAQSLVEFQLCKPTYVPSGIDPTPKILYDAEDVNIPEETYIRLQYRRVNDQEKIFEIHQRYTPDAGMRTTYPETAHEGAKVNLLDWISYPKFLSEAEMEVAMTRTQMVSSVFQTNGTVWWLYEITDPSEYRSTMTKWIKDHVEYRILSYLPAEEIQKVTFSMIECSKP
jgi:hypothetical protein